MTEGFYMMWDGHPERPVYVYRDEAGAWRVREWHQGDGEAHELLSEYANCTFTSIAPGPLTFSVNVDGTCEPEIEFTGYVRAEAAGPWEVHTPQGWVPWDPAQPDGSLLWPKKMETPAPTRREGAG